MASLLHCFIVGVIVTAIQQYDNAAIQQSVFNYFFKSAAAINTSGLFRKVSLHSLEQKPSVWSL